MTTRMEQAAEILQHPMGNRTTDPQLALAAVLGHLGRRRSGPMPGGRLTEGVKALRRRQAAEKGLFSLMRHTLFGAAPVVIPTKRTWRMPRAWQLDQGDTPQCVAFAKAHWHLSLPIALMHPVPAADYMRAKQLDLHPDEEGTDAAAMLKVALEQGVVDSSWWWRGPADTEAMDEWILTKGPVWFGAYWSESMFRTDPNARGRMVVSGPLLYGHETILIGSDRKAKTRTVLNSWGTGWGNEGRGILADADFDRMMDEGGDVVAVIERRAA